MDKVINNILTIDVEEYYHAENILSSLTSSEILRLPDRVPVGLDKMLDILGRTNNTATFFILGCLAGKNKNLIKRIANSGHEIASHGYQHIPLYKHTAASFDEDLTRSIKTLSDITGRKITGYRAAGFSFFEELRWFFDVLKGHGIVYDSSVSLSLFRRCTRQIIKTKGYYRMEHGILEFPVSFLHLGPVKIPIGGGYFRLYPYWLTKWALDRAGSGGRRLSLFYIHPWELDPDQPRCNIPPLRFLRHYVNLKTAEKKFERLLADIKFISIKEFILRQNIIENPQGTA